MRKLSIAIGSVAIVTSITLTSAWAADTASDTTAAQNKARQEQLKSATAGTAKGYTGAAILAYSNKLAPTDRPDIAYATIFPGMTMVKIVFVDIVPALL